MTTASEAQEAQSYWVAVASPSTWTPALPPAAAGGLTTFTYDGDGGRVQQTTPEGPTTFLGELFEVSGVATTKHLFAGALRIAALSQEGIAYAHSDHLGSSHVTTDARGALVSVTEYTSYGDLASGQLPLVPPTWVLSHGWHLLGSTAVAQDVTWYRGRRNARRAGRVYSG